MTWARRLAATAAAAAALAAAVWSSNASMTAHPTADAVLRVAWGAPPERVEICRERTADELSRLPPHMRQPLLCEGTTASYRLTVRAGGALLVDRVVRAGGLRHDRRLYVFHESRVPAGDVDVDVRFDRVDARAGPAGGRSSMPGALRPQVQPDSVPAHLRYASRVGMAPRTVLLVTYDARRGTLTALQGDATR